MKDAFHTVEATRTHEVKRQLGPILERHDLLEKNQDKIFAQLKELTSAVEVLTFVLLGDGDVKKGEKADKSKCTPELTYHKRGDLIKSGRSRQAPNSRGGGRTGGSGRKLVATRELTTNVTTTT